MSEPDRPLTPINYFEIVATDSEVVVKYIIDKLISFAIFENDVINLEKNIGQHCYDVFTQKIIQELLSFEFIAYDKDEYSCNTIYSSEPKLFFDQVYYGKNEWSTTEEPNPTKVDRLASTMIKNKNCIFNELNWDKESIVALEKPGQRRSFIGSVLKTIGKKLTLNALEPKKKTLTNSYSSSEDFKKDYNTGELIDLKNPELYIYQEEDSIKEIRIKKEEEWKMRIQEVALKEKNEKDLQDKISEQNRKQREFDRKNVTADCNGVVVVIKPTPSEKLNNDFIFPSLKLKDYIEPIPDKSQNISKDKFSENFDNKNSVSLKKNQNLKKTKEKDTGKKIPLKIEKIEISSDNNKVGTNLKDNLNPLNKIIFQPVGSNFEYIIPEVGVSITENTKNKTGGKDFTSFFGKPSKYDYNNLAKESMKLTQTAMNSSNYGQSLTEPAEIKSETKNLIKKTLMNTGQTNLPIINDKGKESLFHNFSSTLKISDSLKVSGKLGISLKKTLDVLDLIPDYNENDVELNHIDIFKKRKNYLEEQKESELKIITSSLDEINKFNFSILRNRGWGQNALDKTKNEEPKLYHKPNKKELEKELGRKIVNTKLPRSRVITSLLDKIS